uniref:Uncharacterized protein n=1 Tax=Micrurus corallinus TaxID=54390 RepID=A0A2D4GTZ7_MICCO
MLLTFYFQELFSWEKDSVTKLLLWQQQTSKNSCPREQAVLCTYHTMTRFLSNNDLLSCRIPKIQGARISTQASSKNRERARKVLSPLSQYLQGNLVVNGCPLKTRQSIEMTVLTSSLCIHWQE